MLYKTDVKVLLAIKYASYFNDEYFLQHTLMNCCYRNLASLFHVSHDYLPIALRPFAMAVTTNSAFWSNDAAIREMMRQECNKFYYIETFINYVHCKHDTLHMAQRNVITSFI